MGKTKQKQYICPVCGEIFKKRITKKCQAVYCSPKCAYKGRSLGITKRRVKKPYNCWRKPPRICLICQKEFIYKSKKQKYCSRKCFEMSHKTTMKGTRNPAYVDGRSYRKRSYRGNDWDTLREEIYKRDNYTCQDCGVKCVGKRDATKENSDRIIQCHHMKNYKQGRNNEKSNLIALCLKCHLKRHNKI